MIYLISYLFICVLSYGAMILSHEHAVSAKEFNANIDEITNDRGLVGIFCILFFFPPVGIFATLMNIFEIFVNKYGKRIAESLKVKEDV